MISAVMSFVLRVVLAIAGLFFALALIALALTTIFGVVVWSLIRGRRPKIDASRFNAARGRFNAGRPRQPMGEVVDVEVREVPEVAQRLDR